MTEEIDDKVTTNPIVVGEHSAYTSVEALAKGKKEADDYIVKLKAQIEELTKKADIAEQLKQMKEMNMNTENTNTLDVNEDAIRQIALKAMQDSNKETQEATNLDNCKKAVAGMSGDVETALKSKANELGCSVEYLEGIAKTSPKAFKSMFGIKEPVTLDSLNFLQGSRQVQEKQSDEDMRGYIRNTIKGGHPKEVAALLDKAMKDPSILNCFEKW